MASRRTHRTRNGNVHTVRTRAGMITLDKHGNLLRIKTR